MDIKEILVKSVARIKGQISGIERMREEGRKCADVLIQMSASAAAINTCAKKVLDYHIRECVNGKGCDSRELQELKEMLEVFDIHSEEGTLSKAVTLLDEALTYNDCIDILSRIRHAYAIVIYNAEQLFAGHIEHCVGGKCKDGNGQDILDELGEMTDLYFKMIK